MSGPKSTPLSAGRALLYGTVAVGLLDLTDALVFFGLHGAKPIRILQSIASGLLGRTAFDGGLGTAALGLALHFFIAFGIVAVFYLASRRTPRLIARPVLAGVLYGLAVYAVMNLVVVPLSAAASSMPSAPVLMNGLLIHVVGVGLPSVFAVRATRGP